MLTAALILAVLIVAYLFVLAYISDEAVYLNLEIDGGCMAKIGDSFTARIAPTNAAGQPAPVFNVVYSEEGDSYDISVSPDGMSAVFTANASGTGNTVVVQATTKSGAVLAESVALPDVELPPVDEEATALNLSVG